MVDKLIKTHFEGGKNISQGQKHGEGPSLVELINELHEQKIYSLEETDTGGKFLGKTIFRRSFVVSAMNNDQQIFIPIGTIIEAWVGKGGYVNNGTTILMLPVPIPNSSNAVVGIAIINSGTTIQVHAGSSGAHDGGFVWIEYTKVN